MYEPCSAFLTRMYSRDTDNAGLSECTNDWLIIDIICAAVSSLNNVSATWIYAGISQMWPTVGLNCEWLTPGSFSCLDPVSVIRPTSSFVARSAPFIDTLCFFWPFPCWKTSGMDPWLTLITCYPD